MSSAKNITVTRIVNACTLIEVAGHYILTDPYFFNPAYVGIKEPVAMTIDELPRLTAIIGCHAVIDHWQMRGFDQYRFKDEVQVYVPMKSMAKKARKVGFRNIQVVNWGEQLPIADGLLMDVVQGHEVMGLRVNNYVLKTDDTSVFFGSEARDLPPLIAYRTTHGAVDIAILPVNAVHLFGMLKLVMSGSDAVTAAKILGAKHLYVIHDAHPKLPPFISIKSSGAEADAMKNVVGDVDVIRAPTGETWKYEGLAG